MMSGFGPEGPPVNWDTCLLCGGPMTKDEERFRVEKDGKVGIGHRVHLIPQGKPKSYSLLVNEE